MIVGGDGKSASSWKLTALELLVSAVVCGLFVLSCANIRVNPLDRMGQVSATASVELRVLWFGIPLVIALIIANRVRGGTMFAITSRFVCAAFASIASAAVAGGILAALGKSHYGLGGINGDSGVLISWAESIKRGEQVSPIYPPMQGHLLAWLSEVFHLPTPYAIKPFQLAAVAAIGPLSYAAWRLHLRPTWALGFAVVTTLPFVEAYRPYPFLTMVLLIPILVSFLRVLRISPELPLGKLLQYGALFGVGLGVLFLLYSGWFQWSAPGFFIAAAIVFPWRKWRAGAVLSGVAAIVFTIICYRYLTAVVQAVAIKDSYVYFDATVEPTYIAMWRGGLPGNIGVWPPMGELGGVGLFTVLLALGIGMSVMLSRPRTLVLGVTSIMVGTWLFRFWYAHNMWKTKLVQLYPRTTAELLYCALILCAAAVYGLVHRTRTDHVVRSPSAVIGVAAGLLFLVMSSSSATIDKYMPRTQPDDPGYMAWLALQMPGIDETQTKGAAIETTSSIEEPPWAAAYLIDRKRDRGYSSALGNKVDHEEIVTFKMPTARDFSRVILYPAADGFPVDFAIDVWDGSQWIERVTRKNVEPPKGPLEVPLGRTDSTPWMRLRATKLRKVGDDYVLRLNELELYR